MGGVLSSVTQSVTIAGIEIPAVVVQVGIAAFLILIGCCWCKCRKGPPKPTAGESFKWPSSARFLKRVDPSNPPKFVIEKYRDPIRTDVLPEGEETHWAVKYQPNGERGEVVQRMYLHFNAGVVRGIGYEDVRKLCKIRGRYRLNKRANQTALALECKFSNENDTILFHGWGNGTGLVGNCYFLELNPFSILSSMPGVRRISSDKYKGSFLMLKQSGMGDPKLRARVHTRRVHKWAGDCYPDDSEPLPGSPLHSPGSGRRQAGSAGGRGYVPVEGLGGTSGLPRSPALSVTSWKSQRSQGSSGGGMGQKVRRFFRRKRHSVDLGFQDRPAGVKERSDGGGQVPPWVRQQGARAEDAEEGMVGGGGGGRGGLDADDSDDDHHQFGDRFQRSPAGTPGGSRRAGVKLNTMNYLNIDGVPGRSGTTGDLV